MHGKNIAYDNKMKISIYNLYLFVLAATICNAFTVVKRPTTTSLSLSKFYDSNDVISRSSSNTKRYMFDQLSSAISEVTSNFGKKRITESSIKPALKSVRRALLDADVNINVVNTLIEGVTKRIIGEDIIKGVSAEQQFIKAMYDELLDIMSGSADENDEESFYSTIAPLEQGGTVDNPTIVLMVGLQGAGKTTACSKLALYLKEREVDIAKVKETMSYDEAKKTLASRMPTTKRNVLLVAADVYRPAAIKQLEILGQNINVDVFSMLDEKDPLVITNKALEYAKENNFDTILVDTAGRQVIDQNLMNEIKDIKSSITPNETLLVVDAMTGQEAASLTASFNDAIGITGAILTKLDGDTRGGSAVSVRGVSGKPIKFAGIGERSTDLEPFYPDRMASRILGMGDVVSLVEKAASEVSDEEAMELSKKMLDAQFDFDDFTKQMKLVSKMGSFAGVAKMMPGVSGMLDNSKMREVELRLKKSESMIRSMTKKERATPELLITDRTARSRITRITKGSGCKYEDGAAFMSEFQRMRTMMSRMQKQMGPGADDPSGEMAMAGADGMDSAASAVGNRAMRRAQKKTKKKGGGGRGFG